MNVIIYNLDNRLPDFLNRLQNIPDISIFFTFTREDAEKIVRDVKPKMLFTKTISNNDTIFNKEISKEHPNLSIYTLDVSSDKTDLNFREFPSYKEISLEKIIKQKQYRKDEEGNI